MIFSKVYRSMYTITMVYVAGMGHGGREAALRGLLCGAGPRAE